MKSDVGIIFKHFPNLTQVQKDQFTQLFDLYQDWNSKINVISRKDTENFYERHVLHSLGIAKVQEFKDGSLIMDIGTGGGFPGIPLAILYPNCRFVLVDSIGKKIKVVEGVAEELGLTNVKAINNRAETVLSSFDFIVSRAVTKMPEFLSWIKNKTKSKNKHELKNGVLYLKGGDLSDEMKEVKQKHKSFDLYKEFEYEFFESKKVIHVEM
ncbi:MAG: 16S rRNA (guanine527-N7)-methyltransferase [Lentimonas sp.]|jgi:16S rRNA (guanine527-N7)-methyltransferase